MPIPALTSSMFPPSLSQITAISLMNEILVARKALLACLINSELVVSVITYGASMPSYSCLTVEIASLSPPPKTILSGWNQS